jgi:hypothetical protein
MKKVEIDSLKIKNRISNEWGKALVKMKRDLHDKTEMNGYSLGKSQGASLSS